MTKYTYYCDGCGKEAEKLTTQRLHLKYRRSGDVLFRQSFDLCNDCLHEIADKLAEIPWIKEEIS